MHRFFCRLKDIDSKEINISDRQELHHLRDVLRLENQDKIIVIDGNGGELICRISHLGKKNAKLTILEKYTYKKENFIPRLTVACALPKKSKIDFIVEKLTEVGAERIIFLKTERTQVNFRECSRKNERLRKIAESALKQSGNVFIPEIEFLDFSGLLKLKQNSDFDLAIIPNLTDMTNTKSLKGALEKGSLENILIAIGPEGDFTEREIELAKKSGFVSVSLGDAILRVETAAIITAGFIKLYLS